MGKDYSTNAYKRSYINEYVRSYAKSSEQQSQYDESVAEYNTISKKIGTRTYSKREKSAYTGLQLSETNSTATVRAEGRQRPLRKRQIISVEEADKRKEKNSQKPLISDKNKISEQTELPPPYNPKEGKNKPDSRPADNTENRHRYAYIEPSLVTNPVIRLNNGNYRNIYTKEEINNKEARQILDYAGYKPKEMISLKLFLFICLFTIPLKIIGPIGIIIWGIWFLIKPTTVMEKNQMGFLLRITVMANRTEISGYKTRGALYIAAGIVIGIFQFMNYFI